MRAIAASALISASIWALSPLVAGRVEPWDAPGAFYPLALVLAGALSGLLAPGPWWAHHAGAVAGQLVYQLAFLPVGPLLILGVGFLLAYSLAFVAAAVVVGLVRETLGRRLR